MSESEVGTPGYSSDDVGYATRAPHIPVDKKRIRKYDLRRKEMLHLLLWPSIAAVVLAGTAAWLILLLKWWSVLLALFLLGGVWLAIQLLAYPIKGLKNLYDLYFDSSLLGAVIVRENPLTAAALINLDAANREVYRYFDPEGNEISEEAYDNAMGLIQNEWEENWEEKYEAASAPDDERIYEEFWNRPEHRFSKKEDEAATNLATPWGCKLCVIGRGDWNYKKGDRIPCSSAFGDTDDNRGIWTAVNAIPLVWGTNDQANLKRCIEAISDFEWNLLEEVAPETDGLQIDELYMIHRQPDEGACKFSFEPIEPDDDENGEETDDESEQ